MNRLSLVVAGVAAGFLALAAASPAAAAGNALDPGDALYSVPCDDSEFWQLYGVDAPTAAFTAIGGGTAFELFPCGYQGAYDPSTGVSYYVQSSMGYSALASVDVATGVSTTIGEFTFVDGEFPVDIYVESIAIGGDGSAYALSEGVLYSIDLETAELFEVGESIVDVYAFAWDSVTEAFYGVTGANEIARIDVSDGSFSLVGQIEFPGDDEDNDFYTYSLQFDGAGTLWLSVDYDYPDAYDSTLWSVTFAALDAPVSSGFTSVGGELIYTQSLLLVPGDAPAPPALAATGVDATPVFVAAGILLLGGAVLVLRRRTA